MSMSVADVLRAPVAAEFFALAGQNGLSAEDLAQPAVATNLAALAAENVGPWLTDLVEVQSNALATAVRYPEMIAQVIADPRNQWWAGRMDRAHQVMLTDSENGLDLVKTAEPMAYEQFPPTWPPTSTLVSGPGLAPWSELHAELAAGNTDWQPSYPLMQWELEVLDDARVYEIHGPGDWFNLAVRYRGKPLRRKGLSIPEGVVETVTVDWARFASDWDGLHLSLYGFLTSRYCEVTDGGVTMTLWMWEGEGTYWCRDVFSARVRRNDLTGQPPLIIGSRSLNRL